MCILISDFPIHLVILLIFANQIFGLTVNFFHYGKQNSEKAASIISIENGYYLAGRQSSYISELQVPFVIKIDLTGEYLWTASVEHNSVAEVLVAKSPLGGCLILTSKAISPKSPILIKFDENGSFSWDKIVTEYPVQLKSTSLILLQDGQFMFAAGVTTSTSNIFIFSETDRAVTSYFPYSFSRTVVKLLELPNKNIACISTFNSQNGIYSLHNSQGDVISSNTQIRYGSISNSFADFIYSKDEYIYIVGETRSVSTESDAWTIKMNTLGNIVWSKIYSSSYQDRFVGIGEMANGNIILAGLTRDPMNNYDAIYTFIITTDGKILDEQAIQDNTGNIQASAFTLHPSNSGQFVIAGVTDLAGLTEDVLAVLFNYGICTTSSYFDLNLVEFKPCSQFCDKCVDSKTCTKCIDNKGIILRNGFCECSVSGYFLSEENECIKCHPLCETCFGTKSTECNSCKKDLHIKQMGKTCNCTDYFYYDSNEEKCAPCHPLCKKCYGNTEYECDLCDYPNSYEIVNFPNQCVSECPDGYFRSINVCKRIFL